jgi:hypothetical protein
VLIEIETYPDKEVDQQLLDDLMLIALDRKEVPEVVSLILKPKGNANVSGVAERSSSRGHTKLGGSWPVVELWKQDAESLLAMGDVGLIPWVPLARSAMTPELLLLQCRDKIATVADPADRAGLMAVTQILAGLAFPDRRFLHLFGGPEVMIESPVLDEVKEILRKRYIAEGRVEGAIQTLRHSVIAILEARFGPVPAERLSGLATVVDQTQLENLQKYAATCQDVEAFLARLVSAQSP